MGGDFPPPPSVCTHTCMLGGERACGCKGLNCSAQAQVVEAFKILTSDKQVKAILVNIFGAHQLPHDMLSDRHWTYQLVDVSSRQHTGVEKPGCTCVPQISS